MNGTTIGLFVLRALQILFGAVVLGLCAGIVGTTDDAYNLCKIEAGRAICSPLDKASTALKFGAFVGAFGLVDTIVGLVAAFLTAIPWLVPLVFDALALIFYLAGGINSAIVRDNLHDDLVYEDTQTQNYFTRWTTATAFMFLGFLSCITTMLLVFLRKRAGN